MGVPKGSQILERYQSKASNVGALFDRVVGGIVEGGAFGMSSTRALSSQVSKK